MPRAVLLPLPNKHETVQSNQKSEAGDTPSTPKPYASNCSIFVAS